MQRIAAELLKLSRLPLLMIRKSDHPEDKHLYLVMGEQRRDDMVSYDVWTYNDSFQSLNSGAYNLTLAQALKNMSERVYECEQTLSS